MKKILLLSLISSSILFTSIAVAQDQNFSSVSVINCSYHLQKYLQAILKIPEAKTLLDSIRKEGSISILPNTTNLGRQFGACWDPDERVILVDISSDRSEGHMIGSILFELQNASANSHINQLNELATQGKISKEKYVESMEHMEYLNSLRASKISEIGIKMGVLPQDAYLRTYRNFKEHYEAQIMSGHSDSFGRNYDLCKRLQKVP